jgi:ribosomal protein S18 acetylase RimI-like enzyme
MSPEDVEKTMRESGQLDDWQGVSESATGYEVDYTTMITCQRCHYNMLVDYRNAALVDVMQTAYDFAASDRYLQALEKAESIIFEEETKISAELDRHSMRSSRFCIAIMTPNNTPAMAQIAVPYLFQRETTLKTLEEELKNEALGQVILDRSSSMRVIGGITYVHWKDHLMITRLMVDIDYPFAAVGKSLLRDMAKKLDGKRKMRLRIEVDERDLAMLQFLSDCGFNFAKRIPEAIENHDGSAFDAFVFNGWKGDLKLD